MNKKDRKISLLDYLITGFVFLFFTIVYFYAYVIWPREEKFKDIDRSRMERIDAAEQLYYSLTNDYTEDGRLLFALMEALKDTLYGDSLFEGQKKILLAQGVKKYIIENQINNKIDSLFISKSVEKSFKFSEGIKLFADYCMYNMNLDDSLKTGYVDKIRKEIISNLISHTSPNLKLDTEIYSININDNVFQYSMEDYNNFVNRNVYSQKNAENLSSDVFYKSMLNDNILYNENDLDAAMLNINIPLGFKNRLDTTFTTPIKVEHFYEDSIYTIKLLNFDPTENFEDSNNNGVWDQGEKYFDIVYVNSSSLVDYKGENFEDSNNNGVWDQAEKYKDKNYNGIWELGENFEDSNNNGVWDQAEKYKDRNKNGRYDEKKLSYLGIIPNQDIMYAVKLIDQDSTIRISSYKYNNLLKKEMILEILKEDSINYKIVKRKLIWMDYLTKTDTLSSDSLYSSMNYFKRDFSNKELFNIKITRFDDEKILFDLSNNSNLSQETYSFQNIDNIDFKSNIDDEYQKEKIFFKIPFFQSLIHLDLYIRKLDPPNIIISSPVPSNENWRYWQNIDLVSIKDISSSDYSESSFSFPTPFSFYTGNHGKIVNHIKSWVGE